MLISFPIYSPEEEIKDPLFSKKNVRVYFKRDDKIHPFISGNKWRKLKYNLIDAQQRNINHLVTFGGAWSNHLLATAAAAASFGFTSTGFVRGEDIDNAVLSMCRLFGMDLQFVDRQSYKEKRNLFLTHFNDRESLFLDEGGKSKLGMQGCMELLDELEQDYDHIFVASGTGTTVAGIAAGITQHGLKTQVETIPVLKSADFLLDEFTSFGVDPAHIKLHLDYHFGGYAKTKPDLLLFIKEFVSKTGIMLEPTYTGKLVFGVYDLIMKDYFKPNSKILVIHTGGLTGYLGYLEQFNRLATI